MDIKIYFLLATIAIMGCANNRYVKNPNDPYEPYNRFMHQTNRGLDNMYIKPITTLYDKIVPLPVKKGVSNFFLNLDHVPSFINNLFQGRLGDANNNLTRFVINSTIGIGGLIDLAGKQGIHYQKTDFGKTLAKWGYRKSNYLVFPIIGPSTVRDGLGMVVNTFATIPYHLEPRSRNRLYFANTVNNRHKLDDTINLIEKAGVDNYIFTRESYLQHRYYEKNESYVNDDLDSPPLD